MDNGNPVDTTGVFDMRDGSVSFGGISDLAATIADSETAHSCYAAHLTEYVFSRDIGSNEAQLVTTLQGDSRGDDASLKAMLLAMIQSPEFSMARTGAN
jgi:hypothetical protein